MSQTVSAVDQALRVLRALADSTAPLGARGLSRDLDISKSSVDRVLASLMAADLARESAEPGKYQLGPGVLRLAWRFLGSSDLVAASRETLEALRNETGETCSVSTIARGRRITVAEAESPEPLRYVAGVGRSQPLTNGATGRVLLAQLPEDRVGALLADAADAADAETAESVPSREDLLQRLAAVRTAGFEISRGEWEAGATCLSVPLGVRDGLPAALSVYGPEARLPEERLHGLVPALHSAADTIRTRWRVAAPEALADRSPDRDDTTPDAEESGC
jgi:DNA-binding IclR family transcriptional regulator